MEDILQIECGSLRACLNHSATDTQKWKSSGCAAHMVQHVRKIALKVIIYTIANIYVNISPTSLNLQSPAVKG